MTLLGFLINENLDSNLFFLTYYKKKKIIRVVIY